MQKRLLGSGAGQVSEVDADARLLRRKGKPLVGGYNCQIAVDDRHKLIVAEDVVQEGNDSAQLEPMMTKSREAMGSKGLVGLADSGYFNGAGLKSCEDQGMEAYVSIPDQAVRKGRDGRFGNQQGQIVFRLSRDCGGLPGLFVVGPPRCLPKSRSTRRIQRWEHEDVVDRHRRKMSADAPLMRGRRELVEHPFGTLRRWAGMEHFLMRGLGKCRGEFSLMTLGYNFKRVMNVLGEAAFAKNCLQKQRLGANGL